MLPARLALPVDGSPVARQLLVMAWAGLLARAWRQALQTAGAAGDDEAITRLTGQALVIAGRLLATSTDALSAMEVHRSIDTVLKVCRLADWEHDYTLALCAELDDAIAELLEATNPALDRDAAVLSFVGEALAAARTLDDEVAAQEFSRLLIAAQRSVPTPARPRLDPEEPTAALAH